MTIDDVTVVMTTYANSDFTNASTWALRRFYPNLRVVYVDGHPTSPFGNTRWPNTQVVWSPGATINECFRQGVTHVTTPYVLFMDNDVKVTHPDAIPLALEAFDVYPKCAVSGWYALKVTDWGTRTAIVGTDFTHHTLVDAIQATFCVHDVAKWRDVGGFPWEPFWDIPPDLWVDKEDSIPGCTGDYAICKHYTAKGWDIVTPRKPIPLLHWTQAICWYNRKDETPFDKWYHTHTNHRRVSPFPGGPT